MSTTYRRTTVLAKNLRQNDVVLEREGTAVNDTYVITEAAPAPAPVLEDMSTFYVRYVLGPHTRETRTFAPDERITVNRPEA